MCDDVFIMCCWLELWFRSSECIHEMAAAHFFARWLALPASPKCTSNVPYRERVAVCNFSSPVHQKALVCVSQNVCLSPVPD